MKNISAAGKAFFVFLVALCVVNICVPQTQDDKKEIFPVILIAPPKAGSWLLEKLMSYLTEQQHVLWKLLYHDSTSGKKDSAAYNPMRLFVPQPDILDICTNVQPGEYMLTHLVYDKAYEELLKKKNFKVILILRDPRDLLVSRVHFTFANKQQFAGLQHLSFNDLLSGYMGVGAQPGQQFPDLVSSHIYYPDKPKHKAISHIGYFYHIFLSWRASQLCYTTTFEKLVGPKGGGDLEIQIQEIENIARHIGAPVSKEQVQEIAGKLYGGTHTFRSGKIGSWKEHFTDDHKQEFAAIGGNLLTDLGYEN